MSSGSPPTMGFNTLGILMGFVTVGSEHSP